MTKINVRALGLAKLRGLLDDPCHLEQTPMADGALPGFIVQRAIEDIEKGIAPQWCSPFVVVRIDRAEIVGSGCFKGAPVAGRVELGYGVAEAHQGQGIATEAVRELVRLAFLHAEVAEVYAESAVTNLASRRVLEKAGFYSIGQRESSTDGLVDQWIIRP